MYTKKVNSGVVVMEPAKDGREAPSDSQWRQVAKNGIGSIQKYNSMTHGIAFIPFDLVFWNNNLCSNIAVPSS